MLTCSNLLWVVVDKLSVDEDVHIVGTDHVNLFIHHIYMFVHMIHTVGSEANESAVPGSNSQNVL